MMSKVCIVEYIEFSKICDTVDHILIGRSHIGRAPNNEIRFLAYPLKMFSLISQIFFQKSFTVNQIAASLNVMVE